MAAVASSHASWRCSARDTAQELTGWGWRGTSLHENAGAVYRHALAESRPRTPDNLRPAQFPISRHQFQSVVHVTNCDLITEGRRRCAAPLRPCPVPEPQHMRVCWLRIDVGGADGGSHAASPLVGEMRSEV